MKLSKIFKGAKKGSKAAAKLKGKGKGAAAPAYDWPSGTKIGVYGHDNSGKTVYFTVLNEECKISKNLQISITDNATANEMHIRRYQESIEHDRPWQMDNDALEEANREIDEERYFGACMMSRGYRQVSEYRLGPDIRKRNGFGGAGLQHLAGK